MFVFIPIRQETLLYSSPAHSKLPSQRHWLLSQTLKPEAMLNTHTFQIASMKHAQFRIDEQLDLSQACSAATQVHHTCQLGLIHSDHYILPHPRVYRQGSNSLKPNYSILLDMHECSIPLNSWSCLHTAPIIFNTALRSVKAQNE